MEEKRIISAPFTDETIKSLHAGDMVYISGTIYTARDAAHKRLCEMLDAGEPMPFNFEGQAVYYAGPCPAKPGQPIGSVGPTTGGRMDAYSPRLIKQGLRVMIGKGSRSEDVIDALKNIPESTLLPLVAQPHLWQRLLKRQKLLPSMSLEQRLYAVFG